LTSTPTKQTKLLTNGLWFTPKAPKRHQRFVTVYIIFIVGQLIFDQHTDCRMFK